MWIAEHHIKTDITKYKYIRLILGIHKHLLTHIFSDVFDNIFIIIYSEERKVCCNIDPPIRQGILDNFFTGIVILSLSHRLLQSQSPMPQLSRQVGCYPWSTLTTAAYVASQMMWKLVLTAMYFCRRMLGITWKEYVSNKQVWEKIGKKMFIWIR